MKIILSRKGFDSTNGKKPSPIFENGDFFSLPIPQDDSGSIPYSDINYQGYNFGKVVEDLTKGKIKANDKCHFDPDLEATCLPRMDGWKPMLGQSDIAQSHLQNEKVGVGDLFIFFGWFQNVNSSNTVYKNGFHAIFGWLQIEDIISVRDTHKIPTWAKTHPHFARRSKHEEDVVYIASEKLTLPNKNIDLNGGGLIKKFDEKLILSKKGEKRSIWDLPVFFYPEIGEIPMSYHRKKLSRWSKLENRCILETTMRGQEFVLNTDDYPEVFDWVAGLLESK